MRNECGKYIIERMEEIEKKNHKKLNLPVKIDHGTVHVYIAWESGQCELYFSLYTYESGLCFAGKRIPVAVVSLPFRTLREVLFQWPPQCPTISVCPLISLALFPDRSIDRSYRIDHLFSILLSLFFFRSLSQIFQSTTSVRVFHSFLSFNPFFLSRRSSLWNNRRSAWDTTVLQLSFVLFSAFVLLITLFPMVTEPNTTRLDRSTSGFSSSFVCGSFTRRSTTIALFERVHPFNFVHFAFEICRQRGSSLFSFNKTDLRVDSTNNADL